MYYQQVKPGFTNYQSRVVVKKNFSIKKNKEKKEFKKIKISKSNSFLKKWNFSLDKLELSIFSKKSKK